MVKKNKLVKNSKPRASIIIPAYNEEEGIKEGLESIVKLELHEKYEVIYINDGSSDRTKEIIQQYPVTLYNHNINKGYGASLKTGIRRAAGDKVIILDSDGQHDPMYIEKIVEMLNDYDMVIGERTADSFQVQTRKFGKKIIRKIGEYLVEQKLPDFNSGFRGFNRKIISSMLHIMPNGFSFSTTSTIAFLKEGFTIGTFPIEVKERVGRKSNVKMVKDGSKTTLLLFRIIMLSNPLKIFFPASLLIFLSGLLWAAVGFFIADRIPNSAVILVVGGIFIFFTGLIADQIAMLNRAPR